LHPQSNECLSVSYPATALSLEQKATCSQISEVR
jgi:hypothetical protein